MNYFEGRNSDMRVKGVIFDVDGILTDTEKIHVMAWKEVFGSNEITITGRDYEKGVGITDEEFLVELRKCGKISEKYSIEYLSREKEKRFLEILKDRGVNLFDGVDEILMYLKEKKFKVAACSNSKKIFVENILRLAGIETFFDVVLSREDVKNPKPAPDIYLKVLELLDLKPEEVIVFEDSQPGIDAARSAGLFCVGVMTTQSYDKLIKASVIIEKITKDVVEKIIMEVEK